MVQPIILSTWRFGLTANKAGWPFLVGEAASALNAVEQACRAVEADPQIQTVGYGGYPDSSGHVTLDGAIMLSPAECGAVACLHRFMHPVSLARLVMERTSHVTLVGEGAEQFAKSQGIQPTELLTEQSRQAWQEWLEQKKGQSKPETETPPSERAAQAEPNENRKNPEGFHDTVGVLALDVRGTLAAACSTSGLPYKLPGRVGDSPIIGHGLYVEPRIGAAVATGTGELITGVCGSFLAVEFMRHGAEPERAVVQVLQRVLDSFDILPDHQVGIVALSPSGRWGAASLQAGYRTAVHTPNQEEVIEAEPVLREGPAQKKNCNVRDEP